MRKKFGIDSISSYSDEEFLDLIPRKPILVRTPSQRNARNSVPRRQIIRMGTIKWRPRSVKRKNPAGIDVKSLRSGVKVARKGITQLNKRIVNKRIVQPAISNLRQRYEMNKAKQKSIYGKEGITAPKGQEIKTESNTSKTGFERIKNSVGMR